jgi:hypothetical protein
MPWAAALNPVISLSIRTCSELQNELSLGGVLHPPRSQDMRKTVRAINKEPLDSAQVA